MLPNAVIIASCAVTIVLIITFGYLYLSEKKPYILVWLFSLLVLLVAYFARLVMILEGESLLPLFVNYFSSILGYLFIFKGVNTFFHKKVAGLWDICAVLLAIAFLVLTLLKLPSEGFLLLSSLYIILLLVHSGITSLKALRPKRLVRILLAYTFFLWAAAILFYPLCYTLQLISSYVGYLVLGVTGLIAFMSMQAIHYQSVREEIKLQEESIRKLVIYDKLTGAYNRNYYEEVFENFFDNFPLPTALAIGDVNGLKLINDTFGHNKGDELLITAVAIIKDTIGEKNTVIRWGGAEFIILMPNTILPEAESIVNNIKTKFRSFCPEAIPVGISLGISMITSTRYHIKEIIRRAEEEMYSSKLRESKETRMAIINFLEKILWEKDYQTEEHVMRLKNLVSMVGKHIGLSSKELNDLEQVAMLHDIGKISIPKELLIKPGSLTPQEWVMMKKHAEIGYRIAQSSRELAHISEAILSHHEWWNGGGYPLGIKGEEIPLYARIVSIADAYDVLTHDRPYKQAIEAEEALAEIRKGAGTQYDPRLAKVFIDMMRQNLVKL